MELSICYSSLAICDDYSIWTRRLLSDVPYDKICGLVLFGLYKDSEYHQTLKKIKETVYGFLNRKIPVTLIPQRTLPESALSAEIYILENSPGIHFEEKDGISYGIVRSKEYSLLFMEGIPSYDFSKSVRLQSDEVFEKVDNLLALHGFRNEDIVRQWNYIGNITGHREGKQNYQEFNDSRTAYYNNGNWINGYPAATGIGMSSDGIIVGCIAFKASEGIYPINNPLQVAAHVYSKKVLIDENPKALKSTPKFERAKVIEIGGKACCFVSGTAAIRGEESMNNSSARMQTIQTIENIRHLVSEENLIRFGSKAYNLNYSHLRIYVKNEEDYEEIKSVVDEFFPDTPAIFTVADVCRRELLVEIEGILIS